jgi:hypothetical protein
METSMTPTSAGGKRALAGACRDLVEAGCWGTFRRGVTGYTKRVVGWIDMALTPVAVAAVGAAVLGASMVANAQCPLSFADPANYDTGLNPAAVAVGDFNASGRPGLAIANFINSMSVYTVSILLPNLDGTFQPAVNYLVGRNPSAIAVGDFNGDNRPDLAVADFGDGSISILLGRLNGTFQAAVNYPTGTNASSVAVADFNGDGRQDLAVANNGANTISILFGNGDGTFQPGVNYTAGSGPYWIAVGDFNGDNRPDLAVTNRTSNSVSILLGNPSGGFQPAVHYPVGSNPLTVVVGDFNGDHRLDLAVANALSNNISILLGNGPPNGGTFQAAVNYPVTNPLSIAAGDLDGDGMLDLAVASFLGNTVSVLQGNPDGTFRAAVNHAAGSGPYSIVVSEFNGDGMYDLAVANANSANVSVLLNTTAMFPAPTIIQQPAAAAACATGTAPFSITAAGTGPFTYQWQIETAPSVWQVLGNDPGPISCPGGGSGFAFATPINAPAVSIAVRSCPGVQHWPIRCIVSNACGNVTSDRAILTICPADTNCDGSLNVADFLAFLSLYAAADPRADFNGSGAIDVADFLAFLAAYAAGC